MKDPAFLFYSKDFYEGTRMMLPEERACYIDLLIYQHQNGLIPLDLKRVAMYCSGCSIETIELVLNQKFNQMVDGWSNDRLTIEVNTRLTGRPKKIASASFAGLISSNNLSKKDIVLLKKKFKIDEFIYENDNLITDETLIKSRVKEWFNKMLNQMVKNLANANAIANAIADTIENKEKEKEGLGEKTKTKSESEKVILPFDSENFKVQWQLWRAYKNKEYGFKYKSTISEQASLKKLAEIAENNEKTAIAIINQSIENNWKGFFALKTQNFTNGENRTASGFAKNR